jgi:hypothetical protein
VTIKKTSLARRQFCGEGFVCYSTNLYGNTPPTELADELTLWLFERFRPWSEALLLSINMLRILGSPCLIVTLVEKVTVVELSVDNVCMGAILTPSSSIRPLVKDQIFWKVRDLREMSLSVADSLNDPT